MSSSNVTSLRTLCSYWNHPIVMRNSLPNALSSPNLVWTLRFGHRGPFGCEFQRGSWTNNPLEANSLRNIGADTSADSLRKCHYVSSRSSRRWKIGLAVLGRCSGPTEDLRTPQGPILGEPCQRWTISGFKVRGKIPMNTQIASSMSTVRDAWSEEERRKRRELAGEMQLQLRALVVLAELSNPRGRPR